jgi:GGDEF domain-containing protein
VKHLRPLKHPLVEASIACYLAVFGLFLLFETPGLGIGHGYYIAIALAALATDALGGALAGLAATALYALGMYVTPRVPASHIPTVETGIRLVTYVLVGTLIGYYAARSRALIGRADDLMEELSVLARRDTQTGLPNQRAFELAVNRRLELEQPFALVLCDLPPARSDVPMVDRLIAFGELLTRSVDPDADVARVGNDQFAVLADVADDRGAAELTARIEQSLADNGRRPTAGWSSFPRDARDALGLYTVASERLYARRITHGPWYAVA